METNEVKAPSIDPIPQEAITGEVLRGRGPRRGNLEALLRYWRPRMKRPGGFRLCLATLADHPELYPLENLCAWLHHETTGKWPNEGNHHGKVAFVKRRVYESGERTSRSDLGMKTIEVAYRRLAIRDKTSLDKTPGLARGMLDWKASHYLESLVSIALPGERGIGRSLAWRAVTPGSRTNRGGRAHNAFRCPSGFEFGGRFTNARLSTCGRRIFQLATEGPLSHSHSHSQSSSRRDGGGTGGTGGGGAAGGSIGRSAGRSVLLETGLGIGDADSVVRAVADRRSSRSGFDISRAAQMPVATSSSVNRQAEAVRKVANYIKTRPGQQRLVRRDGIVLQPLISAREIARYPNQDDIEDSYFVRAVTANEDLNPHAAILSAGVRGVSLVLPNGVFTIRRPGPRAMTQEGRRKILGDVQSATEASKQDKDPLSVYRKLARNGYSITEKYDSGSSLVRVESENGDTLVVPRGIYDAFLAENAPLRGSRVAYSVVGAAKQPGNNRVPDLMSGPHAEVSRFVSSAKEVADVKPSSSGERVFAHGGKSYRLTPSSVENSLSQTVASEVARRSGLTTERIRPVDFNGKRHLLAEVSKGAGGRSNRLKLGLVDFATSTAGRSEANLVGFPRAFTDTTADPVKFLTTGSTTYFGELRRAKIRRNIIEQMLDFLTSELESFSIDDLFKKFGMDNNLSAAEKTHVGIISKILRSRIAMLKNAKKTILDRFGA